VTDQLLGILKWALLALLYLFFARVLWAVWSEVRGPRPGHAATPRAAGPTDLTEPAPMPLPTPGAYAGPAQTPGGEFSATPPGRRGKPAKAPRGGPRAKRGDVTRLVVTEPRVRRGSAYAIGTEITFGRADSCTVSMPDDTFVSQLHARVFRRDGAVFIDDLGSTNGTFLNGRKLTTAEPVTKGDRLQIGNTIFEAQ
jgi:hypothetical protein